MYWNRVSSIRIGARLRARQPRNHDTFPDKDTAQSDPNGRVHCASYSTGTGRTLFSGVKRSGPEVDHSFPSSAEIRNEWSSTSTG